MNEPTTCSDCGTEIDRRTFHRLDGRCEACHWQGRGEPPAEFQMPAQLTERIIALGELPWRYRHMAWKCGPEDVHLRLNAIENERALTAIWSERLRAFANDCRVVDPLPDDDSLTVVERAQQAIYGTMLKRLRTGDRITICRMPLIAMPVANRLWPADNERTVLLTPEENLRWNEICPESVHRLFEHCFWSIDDAPGQKFVVATGERLWHVKMGGSRTVRGGWKCIQLWGWNGTRARFIEDLTLHRR